MKKKDTSLKETSFKENIKLTYFDDLDINNYKQNIPTYRENIKNIMRVANLNLSQIAKHVNVTRATMARFILKNNDNISFTTASKFNNYIYMLLNITEVQDTCVGDTSVGYTSVSDAGVNDEDIN